MSGSDFQPSPPMADAVQSPNTEAATVSVPPKQRGPVVRWLLQDSPYIGMLVLALAGMVLHLPRTYWLILIPIYCIICIVVGWPHFQAREARLQLVFSMVMSWLALLVAIFLLYNSGVSGVLNAEANTLALATLLALGTFVAGVQTRVWRICVVGAVLFLAVPGLGWVDQSAALLSVALVAVIAVGGIVWWLEQRRGTRA